MKWLVLALLLLSVGFSTVVVNSLDGRDVVSGVYYAGVIGDKVVFVPPNYDLKIVYAKIGENGNVFLIQSSENPVIQTDSLDNLNIAWSDNRGGNYPQG